MIISFSYEMMNSAPKFHLIDYSILLLKRVERVLSLIFLNSLMGFIEK